VLDLNLSEQMLAALLVFALPGTPVVYYGDEIGMPAGDSSQFPGDLSKRTPMDWSEVDREDQDEGSLLNAYRELARLRHAHPALFSGTISQVQNLSDAGISFLRTDPMTNESVQVVLNLGETFLTVEETGSVIYGSISNHQLGPKQGAILLKHSQGDRPFIHLKKHPSERLVPRPPLA